MLLSSELPKKSLEPFRGTPGFDERVDKIDWQSFSGVMVPADPLPSVATRRLRIRRKKSATAGERDNEDSAGNTEHMTDINREELDAKLSAVEARMDRRIGDFQSDMRQAVSDFRLEIQPIKGMKANIWSATAVMIATIVAVVSLSFTAFDSGRETSALVQEAKQQSVETRKLLEQIQAQQKNISIPAPPKSQPPSPDSGS